MLASIKHKLFVQSIGTFHKALRSTIEILSGSAVRIVLSKLSR